MGKLCGFYSFSLSLTVFGQIGKNQFHFVSLAPMLVILTNKGATPQNAAAEVILIDGESTSP